MMSTFIRKTQSLCKNSKVLLQFLRLCSSPTKEKGPDRRIVKVYRHSGLPNTSKPYVMSFDIDMSQVGVMCLDLLIKLKEMDPTLAFRRSCREGICGSCSMNIQGINVLSCIATIPAGKTITVYPLPHMYVIRDLVTDLHHFFDGYKSIKPYLIRKDNIIGKMQYAQSIKDNKMMIGMYECVLCACCSTSCPSYWWNGRRFLGPATLMHAYRWVIDSRDMDTANRLEALKDDFKAYRCHTILNCSEVCPKFLHPGFQIGKLKRMIAKLDKKKEPDMDARTFFN